MRADRRNVAFLSVLGFLVTLGFGIIVPILPFYFQDLGGGPFYYGILLASFMVTRALFSRSFGRLSDIFGRKNLVLVGASLYALLGYLFTVPEHWSGLLLVRALQGVASAMTWPVGESLITDSTPEATRGRAMSIYVLSNNLGFAAGPLVGGGLLWIGETQLGLQGLAAVRFPFYFLALFAGVATLLVWLFVADILPPKEERATWQSVLAGLSPAASADDGPRVADLPRSQRTQIHALLVYALGNGFSFSLVSSLPIWYMMQFLGANEVLASLVIGVSMSVGIAVNLPAGYVADRYGRKPLVVLGGYVSRGSSFFVPLTGTILQLAGLLVFRSFAFQVSRPALKALQGDLFPEAIRGRLFGTIQMLFNVGAVVGGPLGGFLYEVLLETPSLGFLPLPGVALPFVLSTILGIATTTLVLLYVKETLPGTLPEPPLPAEM